jgi:diguanylate cyclase (GGDEF)-like protein
MSNPVRPGVGTGALLLPATPADDSDATRRAFRRSVVAHDTPPLLVWSGILIIGMSLVVYLMDLLNGLAAHIADIFVGTLFVLAGLLLPRSRIPAAVYPPLFAGLMTLLVVALLVEVWLEPSAVPMAYILLVMCAYGPPTLAWGPFIAAGVVMVTASTITSITWAGDDWPSWTTVSGAAVIIGAVLLRARIRSVNALADSTALVQQIATTDELTGLLNRHGMALQLEILCANAERTGQLIFAAFVDIDGLKGANDEFGHDFGDEVIRVAAQALMQTVRQGDVVARWGGDELIVMGVGTAPDDVAMSDRLHANIVASGIDLTKWPGTVSLGLSTGSASLATVDDLISAADADMYQRRDRR